MENIFKKYACKVSDELAVQYLRFCLMEMFDEGLKGTPTWTEVPDRNEFVRQAWESWVISVDTGNIAKLKGGWHAINGHGDHVVHAPNSFAYLIAEVCNELYPASR